MLQAQYLVAYSGMSIGDKAKSASIFWNFSFNTPNPSLCTRLNFFRSKNPSVAHTLSLAINPLTRVLLNTVSPYARLQPCISPAIVPWCGITENGSLNPRPKNPSVRDRRCGWEHNVVWWDRRTGYGFVIPPLFHLLVIGRRARL